MIRKFFFAINFLLLFSCQNNSVPAVDSAYKNIETTVPKKRIKLQKDEGKINTKDNKVYSAFELEILPKYPGGIQKLYAFIKKNYVIPEEINDDESSKGGVFATIRIEKDGSLSEIKIIRDIGYGSGKELERVLKLSPKWIPAIKDGNRVRCLYSIPYYIQ